MARTQNSKNKTNYHYAVVENDITKLYFTLNDVSQDLNCSKRLLQYKMKKNDEYKGKLKGLLIKKINQTI